MNNLADVAVMDLDGDRFMDAVVTEAVTGKLHLVYNGSHQLRVNHWPATGASGIPVNVISGATADAILVTVNNLGRGPTYGGTVEAGAAPARLHLRFYKAVENGGYYLPGAAMSNTEINAVVENVSFSGFAVTNAGTAASGDLFFTIDATSQTLLSVAASTSRTNHIRLKLKSTAAAAAVTRFYVEHVTEGADGSYWVALDSAFVAGQSRLATHNAPNSSALIVVTVPSALDQWRMTHFGKYEGTGTAANDADPDGDGVSNLMEYLASRNPKVMNEIGSGTPFLNLTSQGSNAPLLADVRLIGSVDASVRMTIQQSSDLQTWTTFSTRTGTGAWTGAQPVAVSLSGGRQRFTWSTATPAQTPRYYLRAKAEEL